MSQQQNGRPLILLPVPLYRKNKFDVGLHRTSHFNLYTFAMQRVESIPNEITAENIFFARKVLLFVLDSIRAARYELQFVFFSRINLM